MENQEFSMGKSTINGPFSIAFCMFTRGYLGCHSPLVVSLPFTPAQSAPGWYQGFCTPRHIHATWLGFGCPLGMRYLWPTPPDPRSAFHCTKEPRFLTDSIIRYDDIVVSPSKTVHMARWKLSGAHQVCTDSWKPINEPWPTRLEFGRLIELDI